MNRTHRSGGKALHLAAALAVVLAACSSDGKTSTPSTSKVENTTSAASSTPETAPTTNKVESTTSAASTTPETTAPTFTGTTKIMVIAPESDPQNGGRGAYPEVASGARAAAAMLNAAGGLNGTKIEIEACDTKADANEAVNCAQKAVDGGFLAVVGGMDNPSNYADTLRAAGVPNVFPFAAPPVLKDPNSFVEVGSLSYLIGGLTGMMTPDVKTISVAYVDSGPLGSQLQGLGAVVTAQHPGLTLNYVPISPSQGDYSPIVTTAAESDAVYLALAPDAIVQFMQTAKQLGFDKPVGVPSATVQGAALDQLGPDLSEGLYTVVVYAASTTETNDQIQAFRAAMAKYEPKAYITDLSANSFAGVLIIAEALKGADQISPSVLSERLNAMDGVDLGLMPPVQFVTPHAFLAGLGLVRVFNGEVMNVKVVKGQLVPSGGYVDLLTGK